MWRALVVATVLSCALQQAEAFSFLSMVFYRMLFPRPQPPPQAATTPPPPQTPSPSFGSGGRSKSMQEQVDEEMATGHSPEEMLQHLILTLISTSREIVPDYFELTDDAYDLPLAGKLHMRKGKVSGVRSYGEPKLQSSLDKEGNIVFTVELHFNNLVATFDSMYMDFYGSFFDKEGRGVFKINKNKFLVKLRVVKKDKIFEKMTKSDCVVFVKSVDIAEISDVIVDIYNGKNQRAFYTSAFVDVAIVSFEQTLREQLTLGISKWMWNLLPDKNAFTCRDSKLQDMIRLISESQQRHDRDTPPPPAAAAAAEQKQAQEQQPKTGVIGSVVNWWSGKPDDKKEETTKKPTEDATQSKSTQQQGWFWNRWNKKSPPETKEAENKINVSPDKNNNEIENSPTEEKTLGRSDGSSDIQDNTKAPSTVPSKSSAQTS